MNKKCMIILALCSILLVSACNNDVSNTQKTSKELLADSKVCLEKYSIESNEAQELYTESDTKEEELKITGDLISTAKDCKVKLNAFITFVEDSENIDELGKTKDSEYYQLLASTKLVLEELNKEISGLEEFRDKIN